MLIFRGISLNLTGVFAKRSAQSLSTPAPAPSRAFGVSCLLHLQAWPGVPHQSPKPNSPSFVSTIGLVTGQGQTRCLECLVLFLGTSLGSWSKSLFENKHSRPRVKIPRGSTLSSSSSIYERTGKHLHHSSREIRSSEIRFSPPSPYPNKSPLTVTTHIFNHDPSLGSHFQSWALPLRAVVHCTSDNWPGRTEHVRSCS